MIQTALAEWLLSAQTPTIRYLTGRNLLNLSDTDPQVIAARQAIMTEGPVPAIFARQTATGHWANEHSYYTPKYLSTHWSLLLLTELCVDPTDERFQRGVDYMLSTTANEMRRLLETQGRGFSCFWGNLLRYALCAGYTDDPRVQALIEYAVRDITDEHCRCRHNGGHSCAWGLVHMVWGLAALTPECRSADVQSAIQSALVFLLDSFSLVEANYPTSDQGKIHPLWFSLNFPLFYQADILFTLRVLSELNALNHPKATAALDWLAARRQTDGRWRGSNPFRPRIERELRDAAETARWVSLQAAVILNQREGIQPKEAAYS